MPAKQDSPPSTSSSRDDSMASGLESTAISSSTDGPKMTESLDMRSKDSESTPTKSYDGVVSPIGYVSNLLSSHDAKQLTPQTIEQGTLKKEPDEEVETPDAKQLTPHTTEQGTQKQRQDEEVKREHGASVCAATWNGAEQALRRNGCGGVADRHFYLLPPGTASREHFQPRHLLQTMPKKQVSPPKSKADQPPSEKDKPLSITYSAATSSSADKSKNAEPKQPSLLDVPWTDSELGSTEYHEQPTFQTTFQTTEEGSQKKKDDGIRTTLQDNRLVITTEGWKAPEDEEDENET
ncbi:MAG: hypothetical protein TREMPRED_001139 [Tremellales sp. Tagirdzhanova-0007]|nr:MAG: hypothetical protein TREMPRED_001139 [Tremellales sp. Tagirdzhanova-0007]